MAMKTTVEISDAVLHEARQLAQREGTTLRALVEQGLRHVVAENARGQTYKWRPVISGGQGLRPELRDATWNDILDLSYERGSD
jgi:hypothetical protein